MANYVVTNSTNYVAQLAITTTYGNNSPVSLANSSINGSGAAAPFMRGKIYDVLVGTAGTPADSYVEWQINRITTSSSATAATAGNLALDTADANPNILPSVNSSLSSASGAPVWYVGMNQRASYRWVCAPGSELVWPTTTSNGLALNVRGTATVNPTATVMWQQQ